MATLVWDEVEDRTYQTGIDHGVLYLQDGRAVVWNGLTALEESTGTEIQSFYLDGVKYLENLLPADFSGKLHAWTYPEEFDLAQGIIPVSPGLLIYEQPPQSFNLSYQTRMGNAVNQELGYQIHLLYNLLANPDTHTFESLKKDPTPPTEFIWSLSGTPTKPQSYRPTVHISIDSEDTPPDILQAIEDILYGTVDQNPRFPSIDEIKGIFNALGSLIITDNGDGTWTALDMAGDYISMINATTFQIDNADATYLDATTYTISTTNPD